MAGKDKTNKSYLKKLGLRLRRLRNDAGLTLEATEEYGYRSWKHLQQIEAGKANITIQTLLLLARIYKVEPWEILKGVA